MMNASQFYALAQQLRDAYAYALHPLCEKNGLAQTALDILLFLHNNPGRDTAKDICTYRHLKPALVSLYVENLVQSGYLVRETDAHDRQQMPFKTDSSSHSCRSGWRRLSGSIYQRAVSWFVRRRACRVAARAERFPEQH